MNVNLPGRDLFSSTFNVSRETMKRLDIYAQLLARWNPKINLVGKSTLHDVWGRHFTDSAQLLKLAPDAAKTWLDIGSGAGFPGLVIAILALESRPGLKLSLIESDARKCAFLLNVARDTGLDVDVIQKRIEDVAPMDAGILTARALAALNLLLGYAERHLAEGGICLFQKGATARNELTEASKHWHMECEEIPSITDPSGVILRIGDFRRV